MAVLVTSPLVVVFVALSLNLASASFELKLYDCNVEYDNWEMMWTEEWKDWCCVHEKRGCPTTETTTDTSTTATTTTISTTTASSTTRTVTVTSTSSTSSATSTTKTLTDTATSTTKTATMTLTATATLTSTSTELRGCAAPCTVAGVTAACGARIRWASTHEAAQEKNPCEAAHVIVVTQCSEECGDCSMEDSQCQVADAPDEVFKKFAELGAQAAPVGMQWRVVPMLVAGLAITAAAVGILVNAFGLRRNRRITVRALVPNPVDLDLELTEQDEEGEADSFEI